MSMRWFVLLAGLVILAYGLWALCAGRVISTWGQAAYRPSPLYWITVAALLLLGGANAAAAIRMFLK